MSEELLEGCVLSKDIKGQTNQPIIPETTVLTKKHIEVIRAFLIKEVEIEPFLVNGKPIVASNNDHRSEKKVKQPSLIIHYLEAVNRYKQMFRNWQSGANVNILDLRQTFVPLVDDFIDHPTLLFKLHHYIEKEDYLFHHAISVGLIASFVAYKLNFDKGNQIQIGLAGVLSDCGMSKMSPNILTKSSSLTPKETEMIRQHPIKGYKMLQNTPVIQEGVLLAVLQHHEREDGSGYPLGMLSETLHPYSHIIAVCDTFHAMTSERVYHHKYSPFKALELMTTETFGQYDHHVLKVLQDEMMNVSVGTMVRLNNDDRAEIIFIQPSSPTRPIIRLENGDIIALKDYPQLSIMDME